MRRFLINVNDGDDGYYRIVAETEEDAIKELKKGYLNVSDDSIKIEKSEPLTKVPDGEESLEDVENGELLVYGLDDNETMCYEFGGNLIDEENMEFFYSVDVSLGNGENNKDKIWLSGASRHYDDDIVDALFTDEEFDKLAKVVQTKYDEYISRKHNQKGYDR